MLIIVAIFFLWLLAETDFLRIRLPCGEEITQSLYGTVTPQEPNEKIIEEFTITNNKK
jgi:hypothetical protein